VERVVPPLVFIFETSIFIVSISNYFFNVDGIMVSALSSNTTNPKESFGRNFYKNIKIAFFDN
jgi:hypothetical protein